MAIIEVIAFYFSELIGIFEWSSRSPRERAQSVGAWGLIVALIGLGYLLFSTSEPAGPV